MNQSVSPMNERFTLCLDGRQVSVLSSRRFASLAGHAQTAKLPKAQMIQIEQFKKSHVSLRNILRFFREQNMGCTLSVQKIYNVIAKIKKNRMQGRTTVEKVHCLKSLPRCSMKPCAPKKVDYRDPLQPVPTPKHLYHLRMADPGRAYGEAQKEHMLDHMMEVGLDMVAEKIHKG
ncbi:hypothetical protein M9H77_34527 [Catharanthus roseus]|uniref:Uncharacterized protein n=1 Tax=Catharanthus roseus TaxID=4058 RepID=A0ACB9ZNK3_CATRO|nr:hypothetical protein M9H77_34527 [Catharanthus roseus]